MSQDTAIHTSSDVEGVVSVPHDWKRALYAMDDEAIIERLTEIRGIGR